MGDQTGLLVILDRDGVINEEREDYIKSPEEWIPIESSLKAIQLLTQKEIKVGIASNQRGLALGLFDKKTLDNITEKMLAEIAKFGGKIDFLEYSFGENSDDYFRKPNPGMLKKIMAEANLSENAKVYFVGDKMSDIDAAKNASCEPVLVKTGYGKKTAENINDKNLKIYDNLFDFVDSLLKDIK